MILVSNHIRLTRWVKLIKRALLRSIFDTKTSAYIRYKRFLIQKRVRIYGTKHFACGNVFIIYMLSHSSFCHPFKMIEC